MRRTAVPAFIGALLASLSRAEDTGREFPKAVPGVARPEWVIWAALGTALLLLFFILFATQGGWRGKRGGKTEPPYF
jgi:hypothetical protein